MGPEVLNLCFHGIGTPGRPLEPHEELYWIEETQFEEILDAIRCYPFVRVTFDDGNASDAVFSMPALRRRGLTATFFVIGGRLDEPGSLTSTAVRDLVSEGMTVGSHGMRHTPWRSVSDELLQEELIGAAGVISAASGRPVLEVACPFGSYDRRVLAAIRRGGFQRVYTVDGGPARCDAWLQPRYTVRTDDTPTDIERRALSPRVSTLQHAIRAGKSTVKRWR